MAKLLSDHDCLIWRVVSGPGWWESRSALGWLLGETRAAGRNPIHTWVGNRGKVTNKPYRTGSCFEAYHARAGLVMSLRIFAEHEITSTSSSPSMSAATTPIA